jgi:hypothetical protein
MLEDLESKKLFLKSLNERTRRQFLALEANRLGWHGVQIVSAAFGVHSHTIRKGQKELASEEQLAPTQIRRTGGGRKKKSAS